MSFQELGETEYLRQINETEYNRLIKKIGELRVTQKKYKSSAPESESIETKTRELTQRRGQFADWFIARNLDIPYNSSQITATAQTKKAETENRKEKTSSAQKTKAKPAHRPTIKITEEGLHKWAGLNQRLKAKEEGLTKTKVKEIIGEEYDCDPYTYFSWLKSRADYVDKEVWDLDENDMEYIWEYHFYLHDD